MTSRERRTVNVWKMVKGEQRMIIVLTGENTYSRNAVLGQLVNAFIKEHGDFGLERLDGEEVEYDRMREALESLPFLASKKLVILRAPSANKQFVENAERLLSAVGDEIDVIVIEPKLDKRSVYYKFLKKLPGFQELNELDENGLSAWLSREAKHSGGVLSLADARHLVGRVGANQQLLANELQKLLAYDANITKQSIDLLVEPTPQSSIFDLLDAAFAGRAEVVMRLYDEQRRAKVEPQQIIAMIAWQLHVLALIKAAGDRDSTTIAKDAKINPYVVRKSASAVRGLSAATLKQYIHEALVLDTRLKSEALDADDATRHYLLMLSQ